MPLPLRSTDRRGTIYLIVLGTAMLVTLLGVSALTVARIQSRGSVASGEIEDARCYARSAVEYGRLFVNNDASWRTNRTAGTWVSNQKIGAGTFTLAGINPNATSLNNSPNDPVVLTGTGTRGQATQMVRVTLKPVNKPLTCLSNALDVSGGVTVTSTTITSDGTLSTNAAFTALISTINANVEAALTVTGLTGGAFTVSTAAKARTMPDASSAFTYYVAQGTAISYGSLPSGQISNALLSPTNNPFGGGTNAQGIYVIDCKGSSVTIKTSRIVGTLVLLNAGSSTSVQSNINMAPVVANYPVLMVQGNLALKATNTTLSETTVNFNPSTTPYNGTSNTTFTDTYPSQIQGLVYCSGNLSTSSHPVVKGVIIGGGTWTASGALDITYDSTYAQNPPPGFSGSSQMIVTDGTWQQATN